jgi:hypothetical protein
MSFRHMGIQAIMIDDDESSIDSQRKVLRELGIRNFVTDKLDDLRRFLSTYDLAVIFADEHMEGIHDLSDVDMGDVKTNRGRNVGTTVVRSLLPFTNRTDVPAFILTAFHNSRNTRNQIAKAKERGLNVSLISKDQSSNSFRRSVEAEILPLVDERRRQHFRAAEHIVSDWCGTDGACMGAAFGYDRDREIDWEARSRVIAADLSVDISDRVEMILAIKESLAKIFGDDLSGEINWLKEADPHLPEGMCPWDCIFGEGQAEMAALATLLLRMMG